MRPTSTLDLTAPAFVADPYPWFAEERAQHAVAWHEPTGMYLAFSHAAVSAVQRDRRLGRIWCDREPAAYLEPFNLLHRNQMMENEPPEHTRLRRPVAAAFNRGHVERLRPRVRALAAELLDQVDAGGFDVVVEYAEPLPVLVIAELLGVPASYAPSLRTWSQAIVRMYEPAPGPAVVDAAVSAAGDFAALVRDLVAHRRAHPADDLITDLATTSAPLAVVEERAKRPPLVEERAKRPPLVEERAKRPPLVEERAKRASRNHLTDDEIVAAVVLLLNAGHEASVNVFGNGLVGLLRSGATPPGVSGAVTCVEEMLRWDSALQLFERTATESVEIAGVTIRPGEKIAALLGAANRDPDVFDAPDTFRADRDPNPHLAFGVGVHFCLGAPLARMELAESLSALTTRWPDLRLTGEPESRGTFVLRGHHRVPVGVA